MAHKLLTNYLEERQQITKQGTLFSDKVTLTHGVPQGSILGPLLFIVYIDENFKKPKHCNILSYADDTTLYYSSFYPNNLEQCINEDTEILTNWFNRHGLKVNASKSQYVTVNPPTTDRVYETIHIKVNNTTIESSEDIVILGVTLDKHMK